MKRQQTDEERAARRDERGMKGLVIVVALSPGIMLVTIGFLHWITYGTL